jgi:hypothetical protein
VFVDTASVYGWDPPLFSVNIASKGLSDQYRTVPDGLLRTGELLPQTGVGEGSGGMPSYRAHKEKSGSWLPLSKVFLIGDYRVALKKSPALFGAGTI